MIKKQYEKQEKFVRRDFFYFPPPKEKIEAKEDFDDEKRSSRTRE